MNPTPRFHEGDIVMIVCCEPFDPKAVATAGEIFTVLRIHESHAGNFYTLIDGLIRLDLAERDLQLWKERV